MVSTERYPLTTIRINSLVFEGSPRLSGEDTEHTRLLAEADGNLPPITVHKPTMRVIDGVHRVRAALLNGKSVIEAHLVDCDEEAAFVLAVSANVTHGLPLSQPDRNAAAARIVATHPQWSDRAVAAAAGLSDKTVAKIRARASADLPSLDARRGRDGRQRPLSTEARRLEAAAIINERPEAGLREIARQTGLSPTTVRDVRERIGRQEHPVPLRYRRKDEPDSAPSPPPTLVRPRSGGTRQLDRRVDPHVLLAKLRNDPSMKFNDAGRRALRWLHQQVMHIENWESHSCGVPEHCAPAVAELARSCAAAWATLAEQLEQRAHNTAQIARKTAR